MKEKRRFIAPSFLAADFGYVADAVRLAEQSGADWLHLDVMDGSFVPPISFGDQMVKVIKSLTKMPLDVHLMVNHPSTHIKSFAEAGTNRLTFHSEAEIHAHRLIMNIKDLGMEAGISIVPSTSIYAIREILPIVNQVLVMTVNPGFGGQAMIPETLKKVRQLVDIREKASLNFLIVIDGGFGINTAGEVWNAGVDVAVMGSAFYNAENPAQALETCRSMESSDSCG